MAKRYKKKGYGKKKRTPKKQRRAVSKRARKKMPKRYARIRRRRLAQEKREAKYAGLTHREYVRRRAQRERAQHARRANMTNAELLRDAFASGQIYGAPDEIFMAAGLTPAQGCAYEKAAFDREVAEVRRRAALGDKRSQAMLERLGG
jgi:hypothetical protein